MLTLACDLNVFQAILRTTIKDKEQVSYIYIAALDSALHKSNQTIDR